MRIDSMLPAFAEELRARRPWIKDAWERRLRRESVTSPLANPDTLVMMMERTLDELFAALESAAGTSTECKPRGTRDKTGCLCGLNPLLAYFRTLAATLCSVGTADGRPFSCGDSAKASRCIDVTIETLREIARRDIASFCAVCQSELSVGQRCR
ncbi:MAG TPA: hypothetical protein VIK52_10690 [Opitutaceae bacterium]